MIKEDYHFFQDRGICPRCQKNKLFGDEKICPECRAYGTNYQSMRRKRMKEQQVSK